MIELNLLPKELRKKKRKKKKPQKKEKAVVVHDVKLQKIPFVAISAGIAVLFILLHVFFILLSNNKSALLVTLEKKWKDGATQRTKAKEVTDNIAYLEKRLEVARKIVKPDLDLARLLSGLNQAVIPNIWLSEMEIKFSSKNSRGKIETDLPESLRILGFALGSSDQATPRVARFISSLRSQPDFSGYFDDIELGVMRNGEVAGEEVMIFDLDCQFKQPDVKKVQEEKTKKRRVRKR